MCIFHKSRICAFPDFLTGSTVKAFPFTAKSYLQIPSHAEHTSDTADRNAGKKEVSGEIQISANVIDNFSKLSAADKAQAPIAELSGTLLEFGKLPNKKNIVPLIGGKVSGTFEITNAGKTPLTIYSVTCDDERVDLSGGKKELKPGATATFKVTLRPKEIKTKLEALINVVCNDPNGPIRLIKVTAYK